MNRVISIQGISIPTPNSELNLAKDVSGTVGCLKIFNVNGEDGQIDDSCEKEKGKKYNSKRGTVASPTL